MNLWGLLLLSIPCYWNESHGKTTCQKWFYYFI